MFLLPSPDRVRTDYWANCPKKLFNHLTVRKDCHFKLLFFIVKKEHSDISNIFPETSRLQKELPERVGSTWIWAVPTAFTYFVFDLLSNAFDFFLGVFCQNVQLISHEVQPVLLIFSLFHGLDSNPAERRSPSPPCIPPGNKQALKQAWTTLMGSWAARGIPSDTGCPKQRSCSRRAAHCVPCAQAFKGCAEQRQLKTRIVTTLLSHNYN